MTDLPSPKPAAGVTADRLVLAWALVALVLMGVIVWAAMQVNDPLSAYVHTDKMRHILAFGALGLCAAFMPTTVWRMRGVATVLTFAMVVEIIQIPIPDRTASLSDLLASFIGAFAGFGFGGAATTMLGLARSRAR
jgi:VanZ family protein